MLSDSDNLNGTMNVVIDDSDNYTKSFDGKKSYYYFKLSDLRSTPSYAVHKINVTYKKNGVDTPFNKVANVEFTYTFYTSIEGIDGETDYEPTYFGQDYFFSMVLPDNSKGKVNIKINGNKFTVKVNDGYATFNIPVKYLRMGRNNVTCTFIDSSGKYPKRTIERNVIIEPKILFNDMVAVGEKATIDVFSTKGTNVTVRIYDDDTGKFLASFSFDGDKFAIPLEKLIVKGWNDFGLVFEIDNFNVSAGAYIKGYANSKGFKASMSKGINSATVKMTGPKVKSNVEIYVDHKLVKSISLKNGKIKYKVSKFGLGKHHVKVLFHKGNKFFSKTFHINIKYYVTLKSVKVKKSAKKLVLSATVKTTKKVKKGLKVTFKFNGKKYKAKTNSKGVAKVTVKKNVLKKLNVEKKVKYQVTYLKHTVKKTAKVKR
jgi:hypothetical protein